MSNGKSGRKKLLSTVITVFIFIIASILGIDVSNILETDSSNNQNQTETTVSQQEITNLEGSLVVTMLDVEQADCFLYEQNGKYALIDCGEASTADEVIDFLKKKGITKLDYLFGTHPHSDHMGGMYKIITNFEIGTVIIPKVDEERVTSTWYTILDEELNTVYVKGKKEIPKYNVEYSKEGATYKLGDATISILEQFTEYKSDLNNYSAIMKISFGEIDIITTGDAETVVEKELLGSGKNIDAEILKLGHHGSQTSSSEEFLKEVSHDYALISSGVGNKHEHPTKSVMERIKKHKIDVYRTDESGTVVVTITTDDVEFSCEPGDYLSGVELEKRTKK